jgi:hypothetical protein
MFSSKPRFTIHRNPMSIIAASVIESATSARVIVAVTAAAYVVVTDVSGSLEHSRFGMGFDSSGRQSSGHR